jgi:hypothetical protein
MDDYHVMHWHSDMDGPWSPEASRKFREHGFDGLSLLPSRDWTPQSLEFLLDLAGLRSFYFTGRLRDDRAVFQIESMEDLTLVTGSKLPVPDASQPRLSNLVLVDRPGLNISQRWPNLSRLRVGRWKGSDLQILDGASNLKDVELEGRRQSGSLDGIQKCASLESLRLVNYSIGDSRPLEGLHSLSEVKLLAAKPTPPHEAIDLAALRSPTLSKIWIMNAAHLHNVESLKNLPSLREFHLIDCHLSAEDMTAISSLPRRLNVQIG